MKKILTISILAVVLLMSLVNVACAATKDTLADTLYKMGAEYGMTAADKVKIERYLAENPVTDEQANTIVAKAEEAVAVMKEAGTKDYSKLTTAQKDKVKAIATEAANTIDVKLVFKTKSVEIYNKDGKLIETVTNNNGKLAYTGNSVNVVLVVTMVAVVALSLIAVARKKLANA